MDRVILAPARRVAARPTTWWVTVHRHQEAVLEAAHLARVEAARHPDLRTMRLTILEAQTAGIDIGLTRGGLTCPRRWWRRRRRNRRKRRSQSI